jgi:hypothetical protein
LEYFRKNHWDDSSIEAAHDIVQDEFDRTYWLLDIEDNGTTPAHASGNGPVSRNFVNFLVAPLLIPNLNDTIQVSTSSEQMNMFDNIMDITPTSSSDDEIQCYLAADVEDVKDGLMWWHEQRAKFPRLSRMARDYLSIPGKVLIVLAFILGGADTLFHSYNC